MEQRKKINFLEVFFFLLWRKPRGVNNTLTMNIPHTVVFKYNHPRNWYFSTSEGRILQKSEKNLKRDIVLDFFVEKKSSSIAAVIYYFTEHDKLGIEYLSIAELQQMKIDKISDNWLRGILSKDIFILQEYIVSEGQYSCTTYRFNDSSVDRGYLDPVFLNIP